MAVKRCLALVVVLVGMGLAVVGYKSQTLAMAYEAARLQRELVRTIEEERVEQSRLAGLTAPDRVAARVEELNLGLKPRAARTLLANGRATGASILALAERGSRPGRLR